MHFGRILEGLWDGRIKSLSATGPHALCTLIEGFLPVPAVVLTRAGEYAGDALVLGEDCRLAPDLPLGDVLAEELDLDVPHQSIVIILPEASVREDAPTAETSRLVGRILAQAVALIAERRRPEIGYEIAVVRSLGDFCQGLAEAEPAKRLGLEPQPFRGAFAHELHALFGWSVLTSPAGIAPVRGSGLQPDILDQLAALTALGPRIAQVRSDAGESPAEQGLARSPRRLQHGL